MYKNVLVPIADDVSARTDAALEVARAILAADGRITLLHVIEQVPSYVASYIPPEARKSLHDDVSKMMDGVAARSGPGVDVKIETGHGGRTIVDRAVAGNFDCIVISSHRPELQDAVFGSTAAFVVRHAPCAVHVLR